MIIGITGRNAEGWGIAQLMASLRKRGKPSKFFPLPSLVAKVFRRPSFESKGIDLVKDLAALIIRPIGRGSLEEIIFRMDLLFALERLGVFIVNHPKAIERCVDKFYSLMILKEGGLPVPRTVVTENIKEALRGFHELGEDVILKPLFGSRGVGSTRIFDVDVATRIFNSLRFHHCVFYLQEFIQHGDSDVRAFVVGNRVVAAMRRIGDSWKTNVSQGAHPVEIQLDEELETLAINAAKVIDCKVAGVDILMSEKGPLIVEVNSQPGWRGLQSVTSVNIADCIVDYVLAEVKK